MRKLSAKVGLNEETFEPFLELMLDDKPSGTTMPIAALADVKALHGELAEQAVIDMAIDDMNLRQNLTDEELVEYKANFKSLIQV